MEETKVKNFYEEEAQYEKSIIVLKRLITDLINIDFQKLKEKINNVSDKFNVEEYNDLFFAVLGKPTDKYYFCEKDDDVKYYNLVLGEVYKISELNDEFQKNNKEKKQLNLKARGILAHNLLSMTEILKEILSCNIVKNNASLIDLNSSIITENDIQSLDKIIVYSNTLINDLTRIKVLAAEQDVYALRKAEEDYDKKNKFIKLFYKLTNKKQAIINKLASKNRNK